MKKEKTIVYIILVIFISACGIMLIYITSQNQTGEELIFTNSESELPISNETTSDITNELRVDINHAGVDELILLEGIGLSRANEIILYRENVSLFYKIEDIMQVSGIGVSVFEGIKQYIYVDIIENTPPVQTDKNNINSSQTSNSPNVLWVNLNTANKSDFLRLIGIGEVKADAIIKYRTEVSLFYKIEDIMNVSGIGKATYDNIKDFIYVDYVSGSTENTKPITFPININTAPLSHLKYLKGISDEKAEAIIKYRTEVSLFYKTEDIMKVYGIGKSIYDNIKSDIYVDIDKPITTIDSNGSVHTTTTTISKETQPTIYPININTASYSKLTSLSGIGDEKAKAIIKYRTEVSLFYAIEDIMKVEGIGKAIFEKIKSDIYVDSFLIPPPKLDGEVQGTVVTTVFVRKIVNLNTTTMQELIQNLGVSEKLAQQIINLRIAIGGEFKNTLELLLIKDFTGQMYEDLREYLRI